ncbi:phage head closure protein [Paenibacillus alkaliterrae]|uniref:phage head closure protein n=1 Tax=Paenibacillus alkaliterrae TaxID=320909 RepID=UPI001F21A46A|nr:phage head closure protein [Paenibacillus alkaliterrae]MCF2939042.1 phage head closure protein [Paenibacillus alkaliterrae]
MAIEDYFKPGIVVERSVTTKKASGAVQQTWATHLTIAGRIRPLGGNERLSGNRETLYATHRLYCSPADIAVKDRVNENGTIYDIRYVRSPMGFGRFLEIDLELVQ